MIENFKLSKNNSNFPENAKVLVAPLNWGIGHATRCVPLIYQLQEKGYQPVIASDGEALLLLKKTFPDLATIELPSYDVLYAEKPSFFLLELLWQLPKFMKTYFKEQRLLKKIVTEENIATIISDNRFGVNHPAIPSIYITHQLKVKAGFWTILTTAIHKRIISKFDICWIPDTADSDNLSGELSHDLLISKPISFIGILSQFKKIETTIEYDILVLLSGPEPQRSILEAQLFTQLKDSPKRICLVKGVIEDKVERSQHGNLTIYNYLLKDELQLILNQSELVIARSGYSTIMDLATLKKKAFFIPTPGQTEQHYLAKHLEKQNIAPYALQKDFNLSLLKQVENYRGFE